MHVSDAVRALEHDLRALFGERLQSLVVHLAAHAGQGVPTPTLVIVDRIGPEDLRRLAAHIGAWHEAGLATPLLLATGEFERSLDVFPFEFSAILGGYEVVTGADPFHGLHVDAADYRRACETRARGHLLHLREGYLETRGRGDGIAQLIARSAAPLSALLTAVAALGKPPADPWRRPVDAESAARSVEQAMAGRSGVLTEVVQLAGRPSLSADLARQIFPDYLEVIERLTEYIDGRGET
jgi:hypothetical protein